MQVSSTWFEKNLLLYMYQFKEAIIKHYELQVTSLLDKKISLFRKKIPVQVYLKLDILSTFYRCKQIVGSLPVSCRTHLDTGRHVSLAGHWGPCRN